MSHTAKMSHIVKLLKVISLLYFSVTHPVSPITVLNYEVFIIIF